VDDSPWEVGKNQPVEVGLVGDIKATLAALLDALRRAGPDPARVAPRTAAWHERCAERGRSWDERVRAARASDLISPTLVAAELRELLPPGSVFVDETISNRPSFVNVLDFDDPLGYFCANGLSLGYSAAAAAGIKLALPDRRVVNVVGDGSLLYYPQALWNAASQETPVLFVVLNNGQYRVLKQIVDRMGGPWSDGGHLPPGLDLDKPAVDFVALAGALGVEAERAATAVELRSALERGLSNDRPYLVEAVIEQGYREVAS
jgi:benzoylformate decarboxylase